MKKTAVLVSLKMGRALSRVLTGIPFGPQVQGSFGDPCEHLKERFLHFRRERYRSSGPSIVPAE